MLFIVLVFSIVKSSIKAEGDPNKLAEHIEIQARQQLLVDALEDKCKQDLVEYKVKDISDC